MPARTSEYPSTCKWCFEIVDTGEYYQPFNTCLRCKDYLESQLESPRGKFISRKTTLQQEKKANAKADHEKQFEEYKEKALAEADGLGNPEVKINTCAFTPSQLAHFESLRIKEAKKQKALESKLTRQKAKSEATRKNTEKLNAEKQLENELNIALENGRMIQS